MNELEARWEDEPDEEDQVWDEEELFEELDFDHDEDASELDDEEYEDDFDAEDDRGRGEELDRDGQVDLDDDLDVDDGDPEEGLGLDDDLDALDLDEAAPELTGSVDVSCPYCGAEVEMIVDPVGGDVQEYVEDCEVCCQPWSVRVTLDPLGATSVELSTLDEL